MGKNIRKIFDVSGHPVLPLRDIVMFPGMVAPLFVGRKKSVVALELASKNNEDIFLVAQKDALVKDPKISDLYNFGVLCKIVQLLRLPDGTVKALIEGKTRASVEEYVGKEEYMVAVVKSISDTYESDADLVAISRSVRTIFAEYAKLSKKISTEVINSINNVKNIQRLADALCSHLGLNLSKRQALLEESCLQKRLESIYILLKSEIDVINADKKIQSRIDSSMEKKRKEFYLNEKLSAIHKELGEDSEQISDEAKILSEKMKKLKLSEEAKKVFNNEFKKLKLMPPMSSEATVVRNYLDWILNVPWKKYSKVNTNLKKAGSLLDEQHYGLEKVKERILEYLAVGTRTKKVKGPILCLMGPPGVGKTSLAKSIADAVGRKFVKISLGGIKDESEIRGHRRTYIGSMPGRIIQAMKKAGTSNPLILLDEIDKISSDYKGDPSSALLEVLDPEQNNMFNDHYLDIDYDLSDVMFVTTSNSFNIQPALLDRLEIIRLSGYTEDEKMQISKIHLIPKQIENHGLKDGEWSINDKAIMDVIRYYTKEAGVRNLERELAKLTRKAVKEILMDNKISNIKVDPKSLKKYLGVHKFTYGQTEKEDLIGVVNGLAYTQVGGDILTIEAVQLPGKGSIKATGKLGDVMQESAQAAYSYIKSRAFSYGINIEDLQNTDIHVHVPEGATPKDGPSAGITIFTAIVSAITNIEVFKDVAMTGEITLRGRVLAIGGLKEKLLSALRGGIKVAILPEDNRKDYDELPDKVKKNLKIMFVSRAEDVLKIAFKTMPDPIEWIDVNKISKKVANGQL